jgi:hypothetical protein
LSGYLRRRDDEAVRGGATARANVSLARYGRAKNSANRHGWETAGSEDRYARWDITQAGVSTDGTDDYRNELNTVQHPGEAISKAYVADPAKYLSHWPGNAGYGAGGATARPRSSAPSLVVLCG